MSFGHGHAKNRKHWHFSTILNSRLFIDFLLLLPVARQPFKSMTDEALPVPDVYTPSQPSQNTVTSTSMPRLIIIFATYQLGSF